MFDPKTHHRHSVRLPYYDYRDAGAYFITVCAAQKRAVFGRLENGAVRLHPYGKIVAEEWLRTAEIRPEIALDEYVVMPDHFHAIVWITKQPTTITDQPNVGARLASPKAPHEPDVTKFVTPLGEAASPLRGRRRNRWGQLSAVLNPPSRGKSTPTAPNAIYHPSSSGNVRFTNASSATKTN